jgi:hypothetical protein
MLNFKNINIGELIKTKWEEMDVSMERTCNFFKLKEEEIEEMFKCNTLDMEIVLKWSKLLEYDFFRIYSHHLILYAPISSQVSNKTVKKNTPPQALPQFRKNLYTHEIIDFILELIISEKKTKQQIIEDYGIPKTTLYTWISKHGTEYKKA